MDYIKRRAFLKAGFLSSAVIVMNGCSVFGVTTPRDTIKVLQNDLFPKAKELGINTADYISIVLKHSRITQEDKQYLKNGVKWLNESAVDMYKKQYTKLLVQERQAVLKSFAQESWGSSWLDTILRYTFEASFGDPVYSGNNNEAGWKWLEFSGGNPRPIKVFL
ncbi:gluconate 2-dehydrogenase subunit 3 family protein [Sulfurimonas sp. SAG-AH-194-C21]|nr:gluconate 2-dehydrogenase subunit 3 family protein [Sulfurimonas sp. SAG-AH-194-C21]MDF1884096.1 gluconate 2-dehydrogenase subunit 3 family protein [Sulfurimonas sp. SAG-AH-194-C21]